MLKLIQSEFFKLRRRKFVLFLLLFAFFMPFLAIVYFRGIGRTSMDGVQFYKWTAFSYTPWILLPVVLGVFSTILMYEEHQNDTLKQLWIVPVSKTGYFFSKFVIVLFFSICFMLLTAAASILFGVLFGYISFEWNSVGYLFKKCMEIAILTAFAVLPLLAVAAAAKGYLFPICVTLVYTFLGFILLMVNMYLHPLSSMTAIVMRDIPGVVLTQAPNITAAWSCITVWGAGSVLLAVFALGRRK